MLCGTFEQIGHVISAKVVCHDDSGRSEGWGTVTFSTRDEANDAILRFGGVELYGRPMTVILDGPHVAIGRWLIYTSRAEKDILGEILFAMIEKHQAVGEQAGKITGMLLDLDEPEIVHLIQTPPALHAKVIEAINLLEVQMCQLHYLR